MSDPNEKPSSPEPVDPTTAPAPEATQKGPAWLAELAAPTGADQQSVLSNAIGGKRGLMDSGLPPIVFVLAFLISGRDLRTALIAALASGVLVAVLRLSRRQSLQQVMAGFFGVGISAFIASRTGKAEDFFLPGLLINAGYGLAMFVSIILGHPLIGHLVALLGGPKDWRRRADLRRRLTLATWIWVGVFWLRTAVQVPLYLAGAVAALGATRVALGLPLYLAAVWLTWRIVKPVMHARLANSSTSDGVDEDLQPGSLP
jgi:hypothetical protein